MPTTADRAYPYPAGTDTPNVPYWSQALAEAVDADVEALDERTPWRFAAGSSNLGTINNGAYEDLVVTFPTSRFSVAPIVTLTSRHSRLIASILSVSSTGFTAQVANWSGATASGPTPLYWQAVQMTSTTAAG